MAESSASLWGVPLIGFGHVLAFRYIGEAFTGSLPSTGEITAAVVFFACAGLCAPG